MTSILITLLVNNAPALTAKPALLTWPFAALVPLVQNCTTPLLMATMINAKPVVSHAVPHVQPTLMEMFFATPVRPPTPCTTEILSPLLKAPAAENVPLDATPVPMITLTPRPRVTPMAAPAAMLTMAMVDAQPVPLNVLPALSLMVT